MTFHLIELLPTLVFQDCYTRESLAMPKVRLSWPYGCKHLAMLAGSWAKWHPQVLIPIKVPREDGSWAEIWSTEVQLPDNVDQVFHYKFIVDGEWLADLAQPHLPNNHGAIDNYVKVSK